MHGQSEQISATDNGAVIAVERGNKGIILINISDEPQQVNLPTSLAKGTYTDNVHGLGFNVSDGLISGTIPSMSSCIIYGN